MIDFDEDYSNTWLELMQAYQEYRTKIFNWAKAPSHIKCKDLHLALDSDDAARRRNLNRLLLVTSFLRSTDMWDIQAILLARENLTEIAIIEQEEAATWAREALKKIVNYPEKMEVADKAFILAAAEAKKKNPDAYIFYNGCMLLYELGSKEQFKQFTDEYKEFIYLACGLDENDLNEMMK